MSSSNSWQIASQRMMHKKTWIDGIRGRIIEFSKRILTRGNSFFKPEEALLPDQRSYIDFPQPSEWQEKMVARWKLLETLSHEKGGSLFLFVPHHDIITFKTLLINHDIKAVVVASSKYKNS